MPVLKPYSLYHFNTSSGGVIADEYNGSRTFAGTLNTTDKKFGAASLDSTTDIPPNLSSPVSGVTDFSIDFWYYYVDPTGTPPNYGSMFFIYKNGTTDRLYEIQTSASNNADLYVNGSSVHSFTLSSGSWDHIVLQRNSTTLTLWKNGTQIYSGTVTQESLSSDWSFDSALAPSPPTWYSSRGYIDELRIRNHATYTTTFTPPTAEYTLEYEPDGEANLTEQFLINADAEVIKGGNSIIDVSVSLTATATDNPSIVFLGKTDYTWDDLDIDWDTWYQSQTPIDYTWDELDIDWDTWYPENSNTTQDLWQPLTLGTAYDLWTIQFIEQLPLAFDLQVLEITNAVLGSAELSVATDVTVIGSYVLKAQSELPVISTMSATGGLLVDAESTIDGIFAFAVDVIAVRQSSSEITMQFALEADAEIQRNAQAQLSSEFTVTAQARLLDLASATLESQFAVQAAGGLVVEGSTELAVVTTVSTTAERLPQGSAQLAAEFALTATGEKSIIGVADLSTAFQITATAAVEHVAQAELQVITDVVVLGRILKLAEIELINFATLTATAELEINASAELASAIEMSATGGRIVGPLETYDYTWDTVPNDAWDEFPIDRWSPDGFFVFDNIQTTATGGLLQSGTSAVDSQFIVSVDPRLFRGGRASLASEFAISADTVKLVRAEAELPAFAIQLSVAGIIKTSETVEIDLEFGLSSTAQVSVDGRARLSALGFLISDSRLSDVRGSANLTMVFTSVFAGEIKLLDSDFIFRIPFETRAWTIDSETRSQPVLPDSRSYVVSSETRTQPILPESRVLEIDS